MFEGMKNLGALANLMRDSGRIKEELARYREELRNIRMEGRAGGGAVRVKVTGEFVVDEVCLDPALLRTMWQGDSGADQKLAEQLIAEAVNNAIAEVKRYAAQDLARRAASLGIPLPADGTLDLPGMM